MEAHHLEEVVEEVVHQVEVERGRLLHSIRSPEIPAGGVYAVKISLVLTNLMEISPSLQIGVIE